MATWIPPFFRRTGSVRLANRGKYLNKLIWLGCISMSIPILLASVVYYQFSINRMEQQIQNESRSSLSTIKDRAEFILQGIEQDSLQLAIDPILTEYFTKRTTGNSLIWHKQFLDKIALIKNANGFISEIFFYNSAENVVLSNNYGAISKESYRYKGDIEQLITDGRLSQWVYKPIGQKDGFITFARLLPIVGSGSPQGVLGFQINTSAISKFLQTDTVILPQDQDLVIVNYQKLFDSYGRNEVDARLDNVKGIKAIQASDKNMDSFFGDGINGKPAQFLYLKNVFGRIYVSIIPKDIISSQFSWIRGATLLVLLFLIAIGVILNYFITRRAYNPIEQLIKHSNALGVGSLQNKENEFDFIKECLDFLNNETEKLGSFMQKIEPTLREKSLQQLLNGDYVRSETLLRDCEAYGLSIQSTNVVLVADAENISKDKRFLPNEKGIIAFAIANVMQELLNTDDSMRGYVLPYQERGVALLQFNHDKAPSAMLHQTLAYAHAVCASLKEVLSFDVSVGIGRFYSHVADVPVSYKEAEIALQYRIYTETEHVLFIEDLEDAKKQATFSYPRDLESAIIHSLERDELEAAATSLAEFAEILRNSQSYNFIYQSYHVLLSCIINSLERHGGNILDILEYNLFVQLKNIQTSKEICGWFVETVFPLYKWLTENYKNAVDQSVIKQICKYIKENCNNDLSLMQCADMVGMSPSYLSRQFKKEMGINFLDFVVACKVDEAKRLLIETDYSVSDVAAAIGYSERNLNRIFQRFTHTSPSVFRMRYR